MKEFNIKLADNHANAKEFENKSNVFYYFCKEKWYQCIILIYYLKQHKITILIKLSFQSVYSIIVHITVILLINVILISFPSINTHFCTL